MKGFAQKISKILGDIVKKEYEVIIDEPLWEAPQRQDFGDLSSMVSLKLASKLKKDPLEIASNLKNHLESEIKDDVEKIEILKPGFINIFISKDVLLNSLNGILEDKDKFFRHNLKRKVILEFLSANPTGPLSIAHGRQAVVGDVIGNILAFLGDNVEREYYVNDAGRQIDLFVESVGERVKEIKGEKFSIPEGGYLGEYVKDVARACIAEKPKDMREFILSYELSLIKKDLEVLGIRFDNWASQQKLIDDKKIEKVIDILKAKDLIFEQEDAIWFSATRFGDDKDRVIKKSDGELTYFASDIAYHEDKISRKADLLINLWGPDHHGYIERVKSAINALGYDKDILKVVIIQLVALKTKEKMSKRKGTAVLLSDLISEVGKDATRFYYLVRKNSSHLEFDVDLAEDKSFNNPLYYVQYASSRIESIFQKAGAKTFDPKYTQDLEGKDDLALIRMLLQFSYALEKAYYGLEPVFIIEYLKTLAAAFHKFYETNRVVGESEKIEKARLNLLEATRIVFHCALNLLGIAPAKKM
ncbi:MAG: arginine--tRNA ligase [Candidatus Omnitrophota bacterium]|jgi:arginyl-tRNA synthetase